jgi:hypothetical protein
MTADDAGQPLTAAKDGRAWRIGTTDDVAWIANATAIGATITAAIPPVFEAYATIALPDTDAALARHEQALLALLGRQSPDQAWWLGYLDTGADDIVFPAAPVVSLYSGWNYVVVEAGPHEAATWRQDEPWTFWRGRLPNLMFPSDRSWLVSTLWDDDWTCIGAPDSLVRRMLAHRDLQARAVALGQDATPPGYDAR